MAVSVPSVVERAPLRPTTTERQPGDAEEQQQPARRLRHRRRSPVARRAEAAIRVNRERTVAFVGLASEHAELVVTLVLVSDDGDVVAAQPELGLAKGDFSCFLFSFKSLRSSRALTLGN